jgi:hypothetical protein
MSYAASFVGPNLSVSEQSMCKFIPLRLSSLLYRLGFCVRQMYCPRTVLLREMAASLQSSPQTFTSNIQPIFISFHHNFFEGLHGFPDLRRRRCFRSCRHQDMDCIAWFLPFLSCFFLQVISSPPAGEGLAPRRPVLHALSGASSPGKLTTPDKSPNFLRLCFLQSPFTSKNPSLYTNYLQLLKNTFADV